MLPSIPMAAPTLSATPTRSTGMFTVRVKYRTLTDIRIPCPAVLARLLRLSNRTMPAGGMVSRSNPVRNDMRARLS